MATLAVEIARAEARKDKVVNGFSGAIRSLENSGLEKGDVLTIPDNFAGQVREQKFGDNVAQYIFCKLNDTENVKPLYPSTFTKQRTVYNEDGTSTGVRMYTTGSAAELFRSFGDVAKGMDALRGKKIRVTDVQEVRTRRYGTTSLMTAQIPVIDLVEE